MSRSCRTPSHFRRSLNLPPCIQEESPLQLDDCQMPTLGKRSYISLSGSRMGTSNDRDKATEAQSDGIIRWLAVAAHYRSQGAGLESQVFGLQNIGATAVFQHVG